ncbi:hypothetical protein K443DRAFT_99177 [Laccaria amethystina LaAM-08-1]|uniref:Uncharacterized protein n=1 Tax=Laccaria amethystina LaAM-08-1 TaxID=1095629 RepID=A0A0C9XZF6_9AGAR|nr:hypothetical protein K443DRAFT_99177 [Laccaria amethystina LaAM-08-1]
MASNTHTTNSQPNKPHDQITEEKKTSPPKPEATATSDRPHLIHATPTQMDTQYVNMLLALDSIPRLHNMLAGFFTWVLLAGFVLFPGTFTSLQNANVPAGGEVGREVLGAVAHVPLFVIAWVCCGIGAVGMVWLWWRWRNNYIWILNRIFLPGLLNSLAGIISTLANAFGAQHGTFSRTARVTIAVTSVVAFVCAVLVLVYSLWVLRRVKVKHDREVGIERAGKHGEGRVEKV